MNTYKKNQKKLIEKRDSFKKMSAEEQRKYCVNKAIKNLIVGSLIPGVGSAVYVAYTQMTGNNTIVGPNMYLKGLNKLIDAYSADIKNCNKKIKELKSKK